MNAFHYSVYRFSRGDVEEHGFLKVYSFHVSCYVCNRLRSLSITYTRKYGYRINSQNSIHLHKSVTSYAWFWFSINDTQLTWIFDFILFHIVRLVILDGSQSNSRWIQLISAEITVEIVCGTPRNSSTGEPQWIFYVAVTREIFYSLNININHNITLSVITVDIYIRSHSPPHPFPVPLCVYLFREHKSRHIDSVFCQ